MKKRLFDITQPTMEWSEFAAEGYDHAAGIQWSTAKKACCGMPLGGIGTGCIDLETSGVLGFNTLFPGEWQKEGGPAVDIRRPQMLLPFLGIAVDGQTTLLCTDENLIGGVKQSCDRALEIEGFDMRLPVKTPDATGVKAVKDIRYWGHYPICDLEYELDEPVDVSMRAYSPFIPGDLSASSIPGAIFEVTVSNPSDKPQEIALAFSYPGTNQVGTGRIKREELSSPVNGIFVKSQDGCSYVLGALGEKVRTGLGLAWRDAWSGLAQMLPEVDEASMGSENTVPDISSSVAVDFELKPGESRPVTFILSWYAPAWIACSYLQVSIYDWADLYSDDEYAESLGNEQFGFRLKGTPSILSKADSKEWDALRDRHRPMYTTRFDSALDVADHLVKEHKNYLARILAWQQEIYHETDLPVWLRDILINSFYMLPETSYWACPSSALGDWSFPLGAFGTLESPRSCPVMGCIASIWYADLALAYFFPQLERSTIQNYARFIREDGAIPFTFPDGDFTHPAYAWQYMLNSCCFAFLVERYWRVTGDEDFLREMYPFLKRTIEFSMNLKAPPEGIISFYCEGISQDWWEWEPVFGMVPHLGGVRIVTLDIVRLIAERMGDDSFAEWCGTWYEAGKKLLEEKLWNGTHYLWCRDDEKGRTSDKVFSCMFDGNWIAYQYGVPTVFDEERFQMHLNTVEKACLHPRGLTAFGDVEKGPYLDAYGNYMASTIQASQTFLYAGRKEMGLEIGRRILQNLCIEHGHLWDQSGENYCSDGHRRFGTDYNQNLIVWCYLSALEGEPCYETHRKRGGLIDRIIMAGMKTQGEKVDTVATRHGQYRYKKQKQMG